MGVRAATAGGVAGVVAVTDGIKVVAGGVRKKKKNRMAVYGGGKPIREEEGMVCGSFVNKTSLAPD